MGFSTIENSFAEEIIATSTGFEDSTILELKNIRGNTASIDSVRIWLSGENEFKNFKTEQGWTGRNTPQGVIIFTTQDSVNPGEGVKFGIKTISNNPIINWKALDSNENVISSATTRVTNIGDSQQKPGLNKPQIVGIKDESNFRFIPEKPISDSDFRVVGNNFVPDQLFDFYIQDKLIKSVLSDVDGKLLFTAKAPKINQDDRTEFSLVDSGGNEKTISIRISAAEIRDIPEVIKLSFGSTPQEVKRGETITLEGMGTPNTTLTITSKYPEGGIIAINTIQVGFDGKWTFDNLFGPDLELGLVSIEISDGRSNALRNIEVISGKLINITTKETKYEVGDIVTFEGNVIPNVDMSVILEDAIGTEIFSRNISVGDSGDVTFDIEILRGSVEGTYVLFAFQGNEDGITSFGIGQEPEPILIVRPMKLNFAAEELIQVSIQGPVNSQVSIILIDAADREKLSDSINLGPNGKQTYSIESTELPTGAYTLDARRGESSGSAVFTIGLSMGSGAIEIQTTRDQYKQGEQILILGNTASINVLLDIIIEDSEGNVIKKINTFSDRFGVFKIDNFRIPNEGKLGEWKVTAKSGGNFKATNFEVVPETAIFKIMTDKEEYRTNEIMTISGVGTRMSSTVTMSIFDSNDLKIDELNITAKSNGEFSTIWQIPADLEIGEYEIRADDGLKNTETNFVISQ